jgi:FkbM family methyltransferase
MQLASSAQNQEDIMLWRALQHVQDGFYIDVGAADPVDMSVTRVFYEHGWHGINLEPNDDYFGLLQAARPRDLNLQLGAGRVSGRQVFHSIPGTGLSTFDATVAERHRQDGWPVTEHAVQTLTLTELCQQHRPTGPIHFLKVDVEGAEAEVLAGADFQLFRPWIVLVEATQPLSQEQSHAGWEPYLTAHSYQFVWFDGLNRFYVADEKMSELARHFRVQPNIFDGFVPAPVFQRQAEDTHKALVEAQARHVDDMAKAHAEYEAELAKTHGQYEAELTKAHGQYEAELAAERQRAQSAWNQVSEALNQQSERSAQLEARAVAAEKRVAAVQAELNELGQARASLAQMLANEQRVVAEAHQALHAAQMRLADVRASTSWRVTRPMRVLINLMRGQVKAKALAREVFRQGVRRILGAPAGRRMAQKARLAAPGVAQWFLLRYRAYEQTAAAVPLLHAAPAPYLPVPMAQANTLAVELDLSEEEARLYRSFASYRLSPQATR